MVRFERKVGNVVFERPLNVMEKDFYITTTQCADGESNKIVLEKKTTVTA